MWQDWFVEGFRYCPMLAVLPRIASLLTCICFRQSRQPWPSKLLKKRGHTTGCYVYR